MISIRIVDVDYYMHCPVLDFDLFYSEFRCNEVRQVPVIEIFGSTPTGQKSCLHVHGVFPYIYIPYEGSEPSDTQSYKIASELDKSINIALGQASASTAHIHNIKLVSGIPLYGYHEKQHQFFKIYFYNPAVLKTACSLLEHGAILGKSFQPHEAHINYILQFMIDYNLHGMSYINLQRVKYRDDPANPIFRNVIPVDHILPASVVRRSVCAIEMDTNAIDILNQDGSALAVNPGLAALWDDEKQRRRDNQIDSQFSFSLTPERSDVKPTESHEAFNEKLLANLLDGTSNESSLYFNKSVYPAEIPDLFNEHIPTSAHPVIIDTTTGNMTRQLDTPPFTTSIIDELVDDQITGDELAVLSLLEELNDVGPIEDDSILSQTVKDVDSSDDETQQQQQLLLSIPLHNENVWNDSFWDENCEVPQLDGIYDPAACGELSGQDDEWEDDHIGDLSEQTIIFDRSFFNTIFNVKRYELRKADDVFICRRNCGLIPPNKLLLPGVNNLITSEPSQKSVEIKIISDICVSAANNLKVIWSLDKADLNRIKVCVQNKSDMCNETINRDNYTWCSPSTSYEDYYDEHAFSDVILNDVKLSDALGSSFESNDASRESLIFDFDTYKSSETKHICSKTMNHNFGIIDGTTDKYGFDPNIACYDHMRRRSAIVRCGLNLSADEHSANTVINIKSSIDQIVPKSKKLPPSCVTNYVAKKSQMKHWNLDGQGDTSAESNDYDVIKSKKNSKKLKKDKRVNDTKIQNVRAKTKTTITNVTIPPTLIDISKKSPKAKKTQVVKSSEFEVTKIKKVKIISNQDEKLTKRTSGATKNNFNMYKQLEVRKAPKRNTIHKYPVDQTDMACENLKTVLKLKTKIKIENTKSTSTLKRPNSPELQTEVLRSHKISKNDTGKHSVVISALNKIKRSEMSTYEYTNSPGTQILQPNETRCKTNDTTCVQLNCVSATNTKETETFAKCLTRNDARKLNTKHANMPTDNDLKPIQQIHETRKEFCKQSANAELKLESTNENRKTEEHTPHSCNTTQPEKGEYSCETRSRIRKLAAPKTRTVKSIKTVKISKIIGSKERICKKLVETCSKNVPSLYSTISFMRLRSKTKIHKPIPQIQPTIKKKKPERPRIVGPLNTSDTNPSNMTEVSKIQLPDCKVVLTPIQWQPAWATYVLGKTEITTKPIAPPVVFACQNKLSVPKDSAAETMSFAEYEPLKKRLRSSINTVNKGENKSSAKPFRVRTTTTTTMISEDTRGDGELQTPPMLHENKNEEVKSVVNCDTTTNQIESIIKCKMPRKQLIFESSNVIGDICSYSNKNEIRPGFREMYTTTSFVDKEQTWIKNEERFIDQVHNDFFTKQQTPRLRKNKHKLVKPNIVNEVNIRKSIDTALISNFKQEFDNISSNHFTKIDNLTIAEMYDLQRGFAPQAGPSNNIIDHSIELDGSSNNTFIPKSESEIQTIHTSKSSTDSDCNKITIVHNQSNLDCSKSSSSFHRPREEEEEAKIHCTQTSRFSYTITFQGHAKSNGGGDSSFDNSSIVHDFSINQMKQDQVLFGDSNSVSEEENVIQIQSQEKISKIKSLLEKSIIDEEIAIASANKSSIATNYSSKDCSLVILSPKYLPPTITDVKLKLNYYNIPEHRYQTPFYSDYSDVTSKIDVGPNMLQIPSNTTADLGEFITITSGFCGLNTWRRNKFKQLYPNMDISKTNLRLFFAGNCALIMEPAKLAPSRKSALTWIRTKMARRQEQKTVKKLEQNKILIPMSPGNDNNDELDATLTLTPCTPQSLNLPDFIDGTPNSSQKQSGQENLQRKALFTVQASSESSMRTQNLSRSPTSNNSFQITGVTLNNTHDFKMSYENLQHARAVTDVQNLGILVLELHVRTRAELYPDPQYDAIRAVFYSILNDVSEDSKLPREETGVIVVDSPKPQTQSLLDGSGIDCVITYAQSEVELIDAVVKLIRKWDPDIFAGYEIEMLSWGYLIERSSVIGINLIPQLSRLNPALIKTKQNLRIPQKELKLRGRIILDIWRLLKHEIALQSYTFENMMYHVLHRRVPAHSFKSLTFWWEYRTNSYRHITAQYYITRVEGVLKLLDQLDLINRTCELARLFGIQFYEVLSRGSQFRVESMMLRLAKPLNYIATSPSVEQRAQMRAPEWIPLIFEPESRLYTDPIIVLDFQSLYPSIIIAYNYCYSTCIGRVSNLGLNHPFEFGATQLKVPRETLRQLHGRLNFSPCGVGFVNADVRKGILPRMLKEILETRLMVKASMKQNKQNKLLQRVLHSRQLGLKLIANVTYGYTSANFSGRMPCIEVGDSVVSKGRETLERAVKLIEDTPKWGARVVYGDTDSLFVLVQGSSRADAFKIGAEIAEAVTNDNPPPIKLKLEKIYQPCILQTKKRYVGYMYESPDQTEPQYNAKGIETVRRDGCPAVAKMLEKSLRILFDTQDVSLVKRYVVRQFDKLLTGRATIQDLIFAREYRGSGGYRPGACVPALELSKRWVSSDRRREPRQGERVPYIIVNGPPGFPLIRLVRCPRELLADPAKLRPNAVYYITRVIAPPLNRCLSLIGADVQTWYCEMPRKQLQSLPTAIHQENCKKSTISQYFATMSCAVCGDQTRASLCEKCMESPQQTVVVLQSKISCWERSYDAVNQICQSCCGRNEHTECTSLDCPVLYRTKQMLRDLKQVPFVRNLLSTF